MQPFHALEIEPRGVNLVEASAGTGKTYAISTLFVRLLLERRLSIDQILVVTFTEAATAELRDRIRRRLRDATRAFESGGSESDAELDALVRRSRDAEADRRWLEAALQSFDEAVISTIHGFCHRVLRDAAFESGVLFDTELMTDLGPMRDEVLHDLWAKEVTTRSLPFALELAKQQITPKAVRSLADKALRDPRMPVVPADVGVAAEPEPDAFRVAWSAARELWSENEVRDVIATHVGLHGRQYNKRWLPGWCRGVSTFFSELPERPTLPPHGSKFGTVALAEGTRRGPPPSHPFFERWDDVLEAVERYEAAIGPHVIAFRKRVVQYVRQELPRRKESAGVLAFDDLLDKVRSALDAPGGEHLARSIRERFPAALIDEFQDTDPVQYAIFRSIYGDAGDDDEARALFLIGDPKQAIYSFRGADVFAYMRAVREAPSGRSFTMGTNWRSDPGLVRAVSSLFEKQRWPFLLADIGFPAVAARPGAEDSFRPAPGKPKQPFEILFVRRTKESSDKRGIHRSFQTQSLPKLIAAEIAELVGGSDTIDGRPVTPGDVAVLTRSNAEAFLVQAALRELGVPSVVLGDRSVFEQREALELQRVLAAVVEPTSASALRAALTTELLGVTASDLAAMEDDEAAWDAWVHDFRDWSALWSEKGFVQMFRALMTRARLQERLLQLRDGQRRMTNLLHLMELLHTAATELHLGPTGLLHWLGEQRSVLQYAAETTQIRLESDERAVKLTTIHKAKGLEYPIVYCPYLWHGWLLTREDEKALLFHDPDDDDTLKLDVGKGTEEFEQHKERAKWEQLAENLRLLYVALTRARHRCTIVWGAFKEFQTSPLGYLLSRRALDAEPPTVAEVGGSFRRDITDDELLEDLRKIEAGAPELFVVRELDPESHIEPLPPDDAAPRKLVCRHVTHAIDTWWRTASFSQLTSASGGFRLELAEGRDRDELAGADDEPGVSAPAPPTQGASIVLERFPKGAKAGNFFHDLLEHLDFTDLGSLDALAAETLRAYGYSANDWTSTVCRAVRDVLATPLLAGHDFTLGDLSCRDRLNELEFYMPVASSAGSPERMALGRFTRKKLAQVFRDHPSKQVPPAYAERVGRLQFLPLQGYLKGYIDLVFRHEGRWFVVDYKTNHLGDRLGDYSADRLPGALARSHYTLQYHLYTVATHRYLTRRVPDYDYDRDFGGVLYLFLKGMTPRAGSDSGVFFEKPPSARVLALSEALERPPPSKDDEP